ncbi:MAG: hypothetical protein GXO78_14140 [Calditrichaeota bacterium]|nr:hypothetical protein [Calditrichota bacterium]
MFRLTSISAVQIVLFFLLVLNPSGFSRNHSQSLADSLLHKGSWSMQFRATSGLSFINFEGSILSVKYHFSARHALRIGVSADNRIDDRIRNRFQDQDKNNIERLETSRKSYSNNILLTYLRYIPTTPNFHFYIGMGPGFKFTRVYRTDLTENFAADTLTRKIIKENTSNAYSFQIRTLFGGEWFFTSRVSLIAEYGFGIFFTRVRSEETLKWVKTPSRQQPGPTRRDKTKQNLGSFRGLGGRIGISIYLR